MVQTETLMEVEVIIDTEIGGFDLGDVDPVICTHQFNRFIESNGEEGRKELIRVLKYLIQFTRFYPKSQYRSFRYRIRCWFSKITRMNRKRLKEGQ